mmetsp:Transcript_11741/g.37507  ORF Transcript_11741/g.37507 Transcript_11741/m.37507 type:complete len:223 (-) Transcript_11741:7914-8582(-)
MDGDGRAWGGRLPGACLAAAGRGLHAALLNVASGTLLPAGHHRAATDGWVPGGLAAFRGAWAVHGWARGGHAACGRVRGPRVRGASCGAAARRDGRRVPIVCGLVHAGDGEHGAEHGWAWGRHAGGHHQSDAAGWPSLDDAWIQLHLVCGCVAGLVGEQRRRAAHQWRVLPSDFAAAVQWHFHCRFVGQGDRSAGLWRQRLRWHLYRHARLPPWHRHLSVLH